MIERCIKWQVAHPVARQVVNALLLGVLTALAWVMISRSAGIVFALISALLVLSGFVILLARFIIVRRRSAH
jgi:hypothetical protein